MKSVKKIAMLTLLLVSLLFILEKTYDFFIFNNKNIKTNYISSEQVNASILFEGSCIPSQTISPEIIKKETGLNSYNLASVHSDLAENYLNIYLYLKNNPIPKIIFLFTGPETFDENYNSFNSYRYSCFVKQKEVNKVIKDMDPDYYQYLWIPFMKYAYYNSKITFPTIQGIKHTIEKKHFPYLKDGYESLFRYKVQPNKKYEELYSSQLNFKWSKKREKYLNKIIQLCHSKKIKLILFDPPSLLIDYSKHQKNRNNIIYNIKKIAKNKNIPFLTFDTLKVCLQKDKFVSNYQLIEKESNQFHKILSKTIKKILIKNS